jgi:hypothetical protein
LIGLSPLSTTHPMAFQRQAVRASTPSYRRFTLVIDSSLGFASAPLHCRPVRTRFRFGCSAERINLAQQAQLVGSLCKRHAVTAATPTVGSWVSLARNLISKNTFQPLHATIRVAAAPTACKRMVSGTVSLAFSAFFSPFPHGTCSLSVIPSI